MDDDLKWIVGLMVSVGVSLTLALIGGFRTLTIRITRSNTLIHARIERVKENYVRRDDLNAYIRRIEEDIKDLKNDMNHNNKEVLKALSKLAEGRSQ